MQSMILKIIDRLKLFNLFNVYTSNTATIFMLHNIGAAGEDDAYELTTDRLKLLFGYLKEKRYNVISLNEYVKSLRDHKKTYKSVVFTVDDGYRDFYLNAFSVFKDFSYPATVFLTSDFIDKNLFMWWDRIEYAITTTTNKEVDLSFIDSGTMMIEGEKSKSAAINKIIKNVKKIPNQKKLEIIDQLVDNLGVDISGQPSGKYAPLSWSEIIEMQNYQIDFYPHTKTHPILTQISYEEKLGELSISKSVLEEHLNRSLDIFCYPNGGIDDFDEETIEALKETGYNSAVTGIPGFNNTQKKTDFFRIHRYVMPSDPVLFKQYICGLENLKSKILY